MDPVIADKLREMGESIDHASKAFAKCGFTSENPKGHLALHLIDSMQRAKELLEEIAKKVA